MAKNYTDTRVGAQNAIRVLSAASGGNALFADTATNVLGGIASVTQLDVSGISTLNNLFVENTFKVTGFSTYVGVASFLNNAFFDSNVTIGGTLQVGDTIFGTDIDTRNLKASGISTFVGVVTTGGDLYVKDDIKYDEVDGRNLVISEQATVKDLNVTGIATIGTGLSFADGIKAKFGNDGDLEIYHSGSHSYVTDAGTGDLTLASAGNVVVQGTALSNNSALFNTTGGVELHWSGASPEKKFEIISTGATITGDLWVSGDLHLGDDLGLDNITGNSLKIVGISTFGGLIDADGDLDVDGHTELDDVNVAGAATFSNTVKFDNADVVFQGQSAGQNMTWDASENDLEFTDAARLKFGNSDDLEIWHGGPNSHIKNSTNELRIRSDSILLKRADDSEAYLEATVNSDVKLFYNGDEKFATTGIGVTVVGNTETQTLNVSGIATFAGGISLSGGISLDQLNVTGVSTFGGQVYVDSNIRHTGDTDTYIAFSDDQIELYAGGKGILTVQESTVDTVIVNDGGNNCDFRVEGLNDENLIFSDGGTDRVGIGSALPTAKLDVNGQTELDTLNVSGVSTFVGDAQFDGNVSIAGTLTKEDVTNIDSVGLITARSGVRITGGGLTVVGVSTLNNDVQFKGAAYEALWDQATSKFKLYDLAQIAFGDGNDLQIYSDGTNGIIKGNSSTNILGITSVTSVAYYGTDTNLTGVITATQFVGLIDGGTY